VIVLGMDGCLHELEGPETLCGRRLHLEPADTLAQVRGHRCCDLCLEVLAERTRAAAGRLPATAIERQLGDF
jgi:hypothetical protein